jgi:hypothetical protein
MGFVRNLTGKTAAKAAIQAGDLQSAAATNASQLVSGAGSIADSQVRSAGLQSRGMIGRAGQQSLANLNPFESIGQQGTEQSGFLTDPNAQFDFLQNNPLFQMGLDNANRETLQMAASRGRLSAGDTLQQLNNNAMLTASPLIAQQKQSIGDLISLGQNNATNQNNIIQNTAGNQAGILQNTALNRANITQGAAVNEGNLLTGAAAAEGAGLVGAANARGDGAASMLNFGSQLVGNAASAAAGAFGAPAPAMAAGGSSPMLAAPFNPLTASDPALKTNIKSIGTENGFNIYSWDWNDKANNIGLFGGDSGVMADEVKAINPEAVTTFDDGFMRVNYNMIGVKH